MTMFLKLALIALGIFIVRIMLRKPRKSQR